MTIIFKTIDPYLTDIGGAVGAYKEAYNQGDRFAMLESAIETNSAVTQLFYYLGTAPKYMGYIGIQIMSATTALIKDISPFLATISLTAWLAGFSIVAGVGLFIKETLSLVRQIRFISLLNNSENPLALIEDLKMRDPLTLKRSLPEWLYNQIQGPSDDRAKSLLPKEVYNRLKKTPKLTPETLEQILSYANKKTALHVIGQVAAVLSIIGGIGMLVAFPAAAVFVLLGLSIAVAILAYAYKKGVVDNPDGGFSLKRCVPEFILNIPKTIEEQIKEQDKQDKEYKKWIATPVYYETSSARLKQLWDA